jgi:hypothetical protein
MIDAFELRMRKAEKLIQLVASKLSKLILNKDNKLTK